MVRRVYKNPPIKEALIDIRVLPFKFNSENITLLRQSCKKIAHTYPDSKTRRSFKTQMHVKEDGKTELEPADHAIDGFQLHSKDQVNICQYRLDGFTQSRLSPYESWDKFFPIAEKNWNNYAATMNPLTVRRLAVRYINQILIPKNLNISLPHNYINNLPKPSNVVSSAIGSFIYRYVSSYNNAEAIITLNYNLAPKSSKSTLILDIDVFNNYNLSVDSSLEIRPELEKLHKVAEELFESYLTDDARRLFDE